MRDFATQEPISMQGQPNIRKFGNSTLRRNVGSMTAGFLAMALGILLGIFLADFRSDHREIAGIRRYVVLSIAHSGPKPLQQAAMAALADGSVSAKEERHIYLLADDIRRQDRVKQHSRKARINIIQQSRMAGLKTI